MVHCGCAAATVLVACLSGATAMPDNDGRPYWKELMSAESPAPALHTLPDRQLNKQRSLATGAERARARGKYKANALVLPQHWIRGDDPGHPGMKMNVDLERAHTANIMPENSLWKDHDSDQDEGHPNWTVERLLEMDSQELSEEMDATMEKAGYDMRRWTDANYLATIEKYNLQDLEKAKHLCPKLYFEPRGSSEEEDFAEMLADDRASGCTVPTMEEPFCMSCESLLGAPVPAQGLDEMAHDPHCRKCGFVNPHGPDGTLLTHARVAVTELEPSKVMADAQERAAEDYLNTVDEIAAAASVNVRPTTEQRCEECGWKTAYYWSAQVRGADEGQTAFFQCVRCQHVWSIK